MPDPAKPPVTVVEPQHETRADERIKKLVAENKALTARLDELSPKLADYDKLSQKYDKLNESHKALGVTRDEERALLSAGWSDVEAWDVVRMEHGKLSGDAKPSLADYAKSLRADGAAVPKSLVGFMPAKAADPVKSQTANPVDPRPRTTGSPSAPSLSVGVDAAAIKAAVDKARESGNLAELAKLMANRRPS